MTGPRVIALVGATATGKTDLAESLANAVGGEVVCADSRQVFRALEIGTGKPTPAMRAMRPHHLFEALRLADRASAGWYAGAATAVCAEVHARRATPVLVGGSGLYFRAVQHGLSEEPPRDAGLRARLRGELASEGPAALHRRLAGVDPASAARLDPRDGQRITRALEVFEASGRPLGWWHAHTRGPAIAARWQVIELTAAPASLAERIERRTRAMFDGGLLEETRAIVEAGEGHSLAALRAVGYDEAMALLGGALSRVEAEARTNLRTRQLAKRQRTWFRHQVEATRLGTDTCSPEELLAAALERLA
jgi:tRNA dimethylallyltransferase